VEGQDGGDAGRAELALQRGMCAGATISHHGPTGDAPGPGLLAQLPGPFGCGPDLRVLLACREARGGPLGLDPERDMPRASGPVAGERDHPMGGAAPLAQVLLGCTRDRVPARAIPSLIPDPHPAPMGTQRGVVLPAGQPALGEGGRIPGGVREEVVHLLPVTARNERGQHGHRLVALSGQEQPAAVGAEDLAGSAASEEIVARSTARIERVGGGTGGLAGRGPGWSPAGAGTTSREGAPQLTPQPDQPATKCRTAPRGTRLGLVRSAGCR
jgi:hypothetical protein